MLKESLELADVRTEILRGLLSVTVYRAALSCPRLAKKNVRVTKHFWVLLSESYIGTCCMPAVRGGPTYGQWAAKIPWMLQYGGAILAIPENMPLLDAIKYVIKSFECVGLTQLSVIDEVCRCVCMIESYKQSI